MAILADIKAAAHALGFPKYDRAAAEETHLAELSQVLIIRRPQ
jgi:hypothetical protein